MCSTLDLTSKKSKACFSQRRGGRRERIKINMEDKHSNNKNKKSIIVLSAIIGLVCIAILGAMGGDFFLISGILVFIALVLLDRFIISPYNVRNNIQKALDKYRYIIDIVLFLIFISLILIIYIMKLK